MTDLDTLRPEVREVLKSIEFACTVRYSGEDEYAIIRAELLRLTDENARLNKIESLATEQCLQMEDVELYLMDVSQPDDEGAPWCDRMKSAIELLVQDCNYAVGQKNKAEAEIAALKARIADSPSALVTRHPAGAMYVSILVSERWEGKRVRLVVDDSATERVED